MINLESFSKAVSKEHWEKCKSCPTRKFYAQKFDAHIDWIDCPYDCENDYEHWRKSVEDVK